MSKDQNFTNRANSLLAVLETNLHQTHEVINTLERKTQFNFTVISAVAVAVVLVNINFVDISALEPAGKFALLAFAGSYLLVAGLSILTLWPQEMDLCPLEPTKDNIATMLDFEDETSFHFELMEQYKNIYDCHMCVIKCKTQRVMCSYRIVAVGIAAVVAEILVYVL